MAKQKKNTKRRDRYILFFDGTKKKIVGENGKYWICEDAQYRKLSTSIKDIVIYENDIDETAGQNTESEFEDGFDNIPDVSDVLCFERGIRKCQ